VAKQESGLSENPIAVAFLIFTANSRALLSLPNDVDLQKITVEDVLGIDIPN
jgi:hypothetical protein